MAASSGQAANVADVVNNAPAISAPESKRNGYDLGIKIFIMSG